MTLVQLRLLGMLKIFHKICIENNLAYYMIGGTFLGAVRHQGFIPWDDDIDVGMPRDSYEKFLELAPSVLPSNLKIFSRGVGKEEYDLYFVKLCDITTTLIEDGLGEKTMGIYIDLFPLDGFSKSIRFLKIKYFPYKFHKYLLLLNAFKKEWDNFFLRITNEIIRKFDNKKIYTRGNNLLRRKSFHTNQYGGNIIGAWEEKEIMNKNYFGTPVLYKFEQYYFLGPQMADEYLKALYGNYMQLPPKENQKSHHIIKYLSLEEGCITNGE